MGWKTPKFEFVNGYNIVEVDGPTFTVSSGTLQIGDDFPYTGEADAFARSLPKGPIELLVYLNQRDGEFRKDYPSYKIKVRNTVPTAQMTEGFIKKGILGSNLDEQIRKYSARSLNWAIDFEPLPLAENRVTPSKSKFDALGIPVPVLYYSVTDY